MENLDTATSYVIDVVSSATVFYVFAVVLFTMTANYFVRKLFDRIDEKVAVTNNKWDDALFTSMRQPSRFLIWLLGVCWAAEIVFQGSESVVGTAIEPFRYVAVISILALFAVKFIKQAESVFMEKNDADVTNVTVVGKLVRISVIITAALMVLQTLGVSISGVLAFGGIGGVAVGFAAKDVLANFFGGLMLYLDRPFEVGDWVRSPDREIEGTVEQIGWRLTLIRTFDQRELFVPNSTFANIAVENPSRQKNRRIYETIGIRYEDAGKMKDITNDVRQMLRNHPDIDPAKTLIVNFVTFAPSSLDFFVYTFTKTTEWVLFHEIKEKILLQILEIIDSHGAEVAFPTSTLHIASGVEPEAGILESAREGSFKR